MVASRRTIPLIYLVALAVGCQSSPWSAQRTPGDQAVTNPNSAVAAPAAGAGQTAPPTTSSASGPDPQAMQEVIAQVQQLNDLDPAARERLLEDLKQTDPRLWQDVIRQFRATLAYRQKVQQSAAPRPEDSRPKVQGSTGEPVVAAHPASPAPDPEARVSGSPEAATAAIGPVAPPAATLLEPGPGGPEKPADAARKVDRAVVQTAYETPSPDAGRAELDEAIRSMEARVAAAPQSADQVAEHARLRMLYVLAGRRDDAMRPIPSASPSVQDFWSKELYGLATWLDTQQIDNPDRRAAEARQHLSEALDSLSHSSALVVRNLAFVTNVDSYGDYRPFAEYKFTPGQQVLVYAEIENFSSEPTPKGYATSLNLGCQLFDSRNQRVDQHEFKSEEVCRNQRRDFFVICRFAMPERIYPGHHTLQLTVEDLKSQKIGQQSIEFTIVEAGK